MPDGSDLLNPMLPPLVLASQTLAPGTPFPERVGAAAAAGFVGIGLRPVDYQAALADGHSPADVRRMLDDHAVALVELEVLRDWACPDERGAASRASEGNFYRMADELGGRHLMAVGHLEGTFDEVAERFGAVADRANKHGLLVALEFAPLYGIGTAAVAWEIVRRADRDNGGILVDTWHHFRNGGDDASLTAIPAHKMVAVQFDDAGPPEGDLLDDTLHRRRLPGQGSFPLERFVRLLRAHGVRAPYSLEVISDDLHRLSARQAAQAAADAARAVLTRALAGEADEGSGFPPR